AGLPAIVLVSRCSWAAPAYTQSPHRSLPSMPQPPFWTTLSYPQSFGGAGSGSAVRYRANLKSRSSLVAAAFPYRKVVMRSLLRSGGCAGVCPAHDATPFVTVESIASQDGRGHGVLPLSVSGALKLAWSSAALLER